MDNLTWTTIDGNRTNRKPIAYCKHHKGFLTLKQLELHRCVGRSCIGLRKLPHEYWDEREERKKLRKERRKKIYE